MILLFSGEGSSDIGKASHGVSGICKPGQWTPGPMALLADQIFIHHMGYSAIESREAFFISESLLMKIAKDPRQPQLRGIQRSHLHKKGAIALASVAIALSELLDIKPIVAVFFRDCDGTRTSRRTRWDEIYSSINQNGGFQILGLETGVPMIPKPKSEAWLICALKINPYTDCHSLESRSGNDSSPMSLKSELLAILSRYPQSLEDLIKGENGMYTIDACRIDMPSFNKFKEDFISAVSKNSLNWFNPSDAKLAQKCKGIASDAICVKAPL